MHIFFSLVIYLPSVHNHQMHPQLPGFPRLAFTWSSFCLKITETRAQRKVCRQEKGQGQMSLHHSWHLHKCSQNWKGRPNGHIPFTKDGTAGEAGSELYRKDSRGPWQGCRSMWKVPCWMIQQSQRETELEGELWLSAHSALNFFIQTVKRGTKNAKHVA